MRGRKTRRRPKIAEGGKFRVGSDRTFPPECLLGSPQPSFAIAPATGSVGWKADLWAVPSGSGKLIYLGSTPTEKQPRGFAIDPKGRFLVVSGEKSDTISAYAIDEASGALKLIGKYPAGKGANWVEIVSFD